MDSDTLHSSIAWAYQMVPEPVRGQTDLCVSIFFSSLFLWEAEAERTSCREVAGDLPAFGECPSQLGGGGRASGSCLWLFSGWLQGWQEPAQFLGSVPAL